MKKYFYIGWITTIVLLLNACNNDSLAPFSSKAPSVDERFMESMEYNNPDAAYMILHVGAQLNNTFHFINRD